MQDRQLHVFFNKPKLLQPTVLPFNCSEYHNKKNFWFTTGKTEKSTNNCLSDLGLIEENMYLSCIHLAKNLRPITQQISFS